MAWSGLASDTKFSIVFHGTAKHNVSRILANGLDPSRRNGQAYGPGEYFAKDPGISVSYCNGGNEVSAQYCRTVALNYVSWRGTT